MSGLGNLATYGNSVSKLKKKNKKGWGKIIFQSQDHSINLLKIEPQKSPTESGTIKGHSYSTSGCIFKEKEISMPERCILPWQYF